jgi:streptogramin lyase
MKNNWSVELIRPALITILAIGLLTGGTSGAIVPGDLLVAEASLNALPGGANAPQDDVIVLIERATGNRSILVNFDAVFGNGGPDKIVWAPNGDIFVTEPILDAIVHIDPVTFNATIFSGLGVGTGAGVNIDDPNGIAFLPNGDLIVAEASLDSTPGGSNAASDDVILRIDRATGNRSILVDFDAVFGGGSPDDIAIAPNGEIFVSDPNLDAIIRIDPNTFVPTIFSGPGVGTGAGVNIDDPNGIAFLPNGDLIVAEASLDSTPGGSNATSDDVILRIDRATGNRSILVDFDAAFGGGSPDDITIAPNGDIFVSDPNLDAIIRIDPNTFVPSIFSGPGVGTGPGVNIDDTNGIAFYVPEPATVTLLAFGFTGALWRRRRRK